MYIYPIQLIDTSMRISMSKVKCRGCGKYKRKLVLVKGEKVETQTI